MDAVVLLNKARQACAMWVFVSPLRNAIRYRVRAVEYTSEIIDQNAHRSSLCIKRKFSAPDIKASTNSKCATE